MAVMARRKQYLSKRVIVAITVATCIAWLIVLALIYAKR